MLWSKKAFLHSLIVVAILSIVIIVSVSFQESDRDDIVGEQVKVSIKDENSTEKSNYQVKGFGEIRYRNVEKRLSNLQENLLLEFQNRYYDFLSRLETPNFDGLFTQTAEENKQLNSTVLDSLIEIRKLSDLDLRMSKYYFEFTVEAVEILDNDNIHIKISEYSNVVFNASKEVFSEQSAVEHIFVLTPVFDSKTAQLKGEGKGFKIAHHSCNDTPYYIFEELLKSESDNSIERLKDEILLGAKEDCRKEKEVAAEKLLSKKIDNLYDRAKAVEYSNYWWNARNPKFGVYDNYGGNCNNFISQALFHSGIPMDLKGKNVWKWLDESPSNSVEQSGRSSSWSSVNEFCNYATNNSGFGLSAAVSNSIEGAEIGDVIQMGLLDKFRHSVIISDIKNDVIFINCNSPNTKSYPLDAYFYTLKRLIKIYGYNDE